MRSWEGISFDGETRNNYSMVPSSPTEAEDTTPIGKDDHR
jgi:hypothetical protein